MIAKITKIGLLFTIIASALHAQATSLATQCQNLYNADVLACTNALSVMLGPQGQEQTGHIVALNNCKASAQDRKDNFCMQNIPLDQWRKLPVAIPGRDPNPTQVHIPTATPPGGPPPVSGSGYMGAYVQYPQINNNADNFVGFYKMFGGNGTVTYGPLVIIGVVE